MRILIGDRPDDALMLTSLLEAAGYQGVRAYNTDTIIQMARNNHPDLVLLEMITPNIDGFEVCRQIRKMCNGPIIFLSKQTNANTIVRALRLGGDDCLSKPFEPPELLARIQATLRRYKIDTQTPFSTTISNGRFTLEPLRCRVVRDDGYSIVLAPIEFRLLYLLVENAGQILNTSQMLDGVQLAPKDANTNLIAQYIYRLRGKIEANVEKPRHIITVPKKGYMFVG